MPNKPTSEKQQQAIKVIREKFAKVDKLECTVTGLENEVQQLERKWNKAFPKPRPWYTSFGVWFALLLVLGMIYLVWLFYMGETGHSIKIPRWLNR